MEENLTSDKKAPEKEPSVQDMTSVQDESAQESCLEEDNTVKQLTQAPVQIEDLTVEVEADILPAQAKTAKSRRMYRYVLVALLLSACFCGGIVLGGLQLVSLQASYPYIQLNTQGSYEKSSQLSQRVLELSYLLEKEALNMVDVDQLTPSLYETMLAGLEDDYAYYFSPEEFRTFQESTQGSFGGIGVVLSQKDDGAYVYKVYADTPADRAGLQPGDKIMSINGEYKELWTVDEVASRLRSPVNTEHTLSWISYDKQGNATEEKSVQLSTEEIEFPSVSYENLGEIGLISVKKFTDQTSDQTKNALEVLQQQGVRGIILDMRSNPGGPLVQAIKLSSQFLGKKKILSTELKDGQVEEEFASDDALVDLPLVVLIDENSASSTEIVSSALQDYQRALVVGELSYGKGTVQIVHNLSFGGGVKFTIAHYLSALGHKVDKQGVLPDLRASWKAGDQVIDLKHQNLAVKSLGDKSYAEASEERVQELMRHDNQLRCAWELMKEVLTKGTLELDSLDNPVGAQEELTRQARIEREASSAQQDDR